MTQSDLGQGLGTDGSDVGKQVVYGWEKDQHYPRVDQLMLICTKLRCSADFLLFGEQSAVSPRIVAAQALVSQLTDDERREFFTKNVRDTQDTRKHGDRDLETDYSKLINKEPLPPRRGVTDNIDELREAFRTEKPKQPARRRGSRGP